MRQIHYSIFKVDTVPYCVWEWDLKERNLEFINSIDHRYFEYLAGVHFDKIQSESEDRQLAAIALRMAYYHGLETLFTLLCATLQAPDCVFGWVLKSRPPNIRNIVKKISSPGAKIFNKHRLEYVNWEELSIRIHAFSNKDEKRVDETAQCFADLWDRFSSDYLNEMNISEYNSIKHGLRTSLGGFGLSIGIEEEHGKAAPPEKMHSLGRHKFGSSFFIAEKIKGCPESKKKDIHFKARRNSLNWNPENIAYGLVLESMSINNIISYLKTISGIDPSKCLFLRPKDAEDFKKPWQYSVSPIWCSMDLIVSEDDIKRYTEEEISNKLDEPPKNGQ